MEKIEPALTAEEWEVRQIAGDEEDEVAFLSNDALITSGVSADDSFCSAGAGFTGKRRHALAALALHGQPFGFTWEDVDRLRRWADVSRDASDHSEQSGVDAVQVDSLAARIAALLPPRGER